LRDIDGDERPTMLEATTPIQHAKERIKLSFNIGTKQCLLMHTMGIIKRCWVNQMEHPLYGVALYLNIGKFFPLLKANDDAILDT
jgi:hypothetical protein